MRPSMGSVGDAYDNAMCESFFATLECELLDRCRFKTQAEARNATFAFIEGFYNPRRRHSSIGYLSPIDYERRHHALTVDPDAHQPAAVLAAVKDKPFGRPQDGAVLDRRCARRPHHRAGRDGRMAPPGAEPKNGTTTGGQNAVKSDSLIPSPHLSTKPGQVQPSPWKSGGIDVEQGYLKGWECPVAQDDDPNGMVVATAPALKYSQSMRFHERVGDRRGKIDRITTVAVARKLLIALWRYVTLGLVPEGAELKV